MNWFTKNTGLSLTTKEYKPSDPSYLHYKLERLGLIGDLYPLVVSEGRGDEGTQGSRDLGIIGI